jgi:N,N'-diacetyllegionaminate synthase
MSDAPFLIAEAGVNHNGDIARALDMVDAAADAGADCVKFQAFAPEKLIARGTKAAAYQTRNTGEADQLEMIRSLALTLDEFARLAQRCRDRHIEFLATAFDVDMVEDLVRLGMQRIKVASGEMTNHPALERFAGLDLPVVLSTGMADDAEIDAAVDVLRARGAGDITLLQCTSIYPAPAALANLRAMVAMGARNALPYGYSDHTMGDHLAVAAVALGASVIEKHFTLDRSLPGPDHKASLLPRELAELVVRLKETAASLGVAEKRPGAEELQTAALVRRSWHAARDLPAGTVLTARDLVLKRPASGLGPEQRIIGRRLMTTVPADSPITAAALGGG